MSEVLMIFKVGSAALSVAKYTGLLQDKLKLQISQLAGSELEAGIRALEQAANSENEHSPLLREARARFNKAISLEKDYRLAAAYLGLALCHARLQDHKNAQLAIQSLSLIEPPDVNVALKVTKKVAEAPAILRINPYTLAIAALDIFVLKEIRDKEEQRITDFCSLKESANDVFELSVREGVDFVFSVSSK